MRSRANDKTLLDRPLRTFHTTTTRRSHPRPGRRGGNEKESAFWWQEFTTTALHGHLQKSP